MSTAPNNADSLCAGSVYLDADEWTYETLCTTGVSGIHIQSRAAEQEQDRARSTAPKLSLVTEEMRRKWHLAEGHAAKEDGAGGRDKDARLDILEETRFCNIVPVLPRTFPFHDMVQQVIPCTLQRVEAPLPVASSSLATAAVHGRRLSGRFVAHGLRAAQREHLLHALYLGSHPGKAARLASPSPLQTGSSAVQTAEELETAQQQQQQLREAVERQVSTLRNNMDDFPGDRCREEQRVSRFTSAVTAGAGEGNAPVDGGGDGTSALPSVSSSPLSSASSSRASSLQRSDSDSDNKDDGSCTSSSGSPTAHAHWPSRLTAKGKTLLQRGTVSRQRARAARAERRSPQRQQAKAWRAVTAAGAGAVVEWASSGTVGFTRDTDGLHAESVFRLTRTYHLPPVSNAGGGGATFPPSFVPSPPDTRAGEEGRSECFLLPAAPVDDSCDALVPQHSNGLLPPPPPIRSPKLLRAAAATQAVWLSRFQKERTAYFHRQESLPPAMQSIVSAAAVAAAVPAPAAQSNDTEGENRHSTPANPPAFSFPSSSSTAAALLHAPTTLGPPCQCHSCCGWRALFAQLTFCSQSLRQYLDHLHIASTLPAASTAGTDSADKPQKRKGGNGGGAAARGDPHHGAALSAAAVAHLATRWTSATSNDVDPTAIFPMLQHLCANVNGGDHDSSTSVKQEEVKGEDGECLDDAKECRDEQDQRMLSSLEWLDDAVLDELLLVSVAPQGLPYQQRLLPPSAAFFEVLTTRLAERLDKLMQEAVPPIKKATSACAAADAASTPASVASQQDETRANWERDVAWCRAVHQTLFYQFVDTASEGVPARLLSASELASRLRQKLCCCRCSAPLFQLSLPTRLATTPEGSSSCFTPEDYSAAAEVYARAVGGPDAAVPAEVRSHFAAVRVFAEAEVRSIKAAVQDGLVSHILTALRPVLYRRSFIMYELLRLLASKSLYIANKALVGKYRLWYVDTPSPAAVLRLLQRSSLFGAALARAFPAFSDDSPRREQPRAQRSGNPSRPKEEAPAEVKKEELEEAEEDGGSAASGRGRKRRRTDSADSTTRADAFSHDASDAEECPDTWSSLSFVPECALLHPEYLERFTAWVKQTYHTSGASGNGNGNGGAIGGEHGVQPRWQPHASSAYRPNTSAAVSDGFSAAAAIAAIVGSSGGHSRYSAHTAGFTDPALNAVLRSLVRKGRTMTGPEIDHYILSTVHV